MQHGINEAEQRRNLDNMKKKLGIIERLKAAKTEKEVAELTKEIGKWSSEQVPGPSDKTVRKFSKIQRRLRAQFRKKNGRKS